MKQDYELHWSLQQGQLLKCFVFTEEMDVTRYSDSVSCEFALVYLPKLLALLAVLGSISWYGFVHTYLLLYSKVWHWKEN